MQLNAQAFKDPTASWHQYQAVPTSRATPNITDDDVWDFQWQNEFCN